MAIDEEKVGIYQVENKKYVYGVKDIHRQEYSLSIFFSKASYFVMKNDHYIFHDGDEKCMATNVRVAHNGKSFRSIAKPWTSVNVKIIYHVSDNIHYDKMSKIA